MKQKKYSELTFVFSLICFFVPFFENVMTFYDLYILFVNRREHSYLFEISVLLCFVCITSCTIGIVSYWDAQLFLGPWLPNSLVHFANNIQVSTKLIHQINWSHFFANTIIKILNFLFYYRNHVGGPDEIWNDMFNCKFIQIRHFLIVVHVENCTLLSCVEL